MLGRDRLHRLTLQVVPRDAAGHGLQVARGARVQAQRDLELLGLQAVRMRGHHLLEHAQLERQETRAEQVRIELEQGVQHRMQRASGVALLLLLLRLGVSGLGFVVHEVSSAGVDAPAMFRATASPTLMPSTPADRMPPA